MIISDPNQLIGQQIDQYKIRQFIARGGFADVYLAEDTNLNRQAALKIMLPALAADDQFVARFHREAQTVAQLDHPHIVQIYGIGQTDSHRPYLAMQYIEGGALEDTIEQLQARGEQLETRRALGIIARMAEALIAAHNANIVHRDLKPSNILIRPNGAPILVDLGIAQMEGGPKLTHTGTLIGTPHYMAPEQVSGKKLDGRSDIYSLGIILYELLAGQKPFKAEEPMAILHMHVHEPPPLLQDKRPGLARETYQVVTTCLRKDPDQRYQTAAELLQALNTAIQAEGGEGHTSPSGKWRPHPSDQYRLPPSSTTQQLEEKATRKRPAWIYALIPIGLILLIFLIFPFIEDPIFISSAPSTTPTTTPTASLTIDNSQLTIDNSPTPTTPAPTSTVAAATGEPTPEPIATPTTTPSPTPTIDPSPETIEIGRSASGQPIEAERIGGGENVIILIGGLHAGFAPATVAIAQEAIKYFTGELDRVPFSVTLYIIPNANPDSQLDPGQLNGRLNANGVDLNRNWDCDWVADPLWRNVPATGTGGSEPFSEPETIALRDFILAQDPAAVIFWEARASDGLSAPGACDPNSQVSVNLAITYGRASGYPVTDFETLTNQELNGDSTNWLDQQGIPAIAILLPDYNDMDWNRNLAGLLAVLAQHDLSR